MIFTLFTLLLISISCKPKYDLDCNELSMKKYKGIPNSYQKFEQNCKGVEIKYTEKLCQSALLELMRTKNLSEVKKQFGDPIEHCFTGDDLKRFNKN